MVVQLVLPQRCAVCSLPGAALCAPCRNGLVRLAPPLCARCGAPGAWPVSRCAECAGRRLAFASARAALVYERRARALVVAWKERGRRDLAGPAAELVVAGVPRPAVQALTFVPADRERGLRRGHAPAERLARELGRRWELPVLALLDRTRRVEQQRGLDLQARRRNVAGAFASRGPPPASVALVDDVYTSGSTANACATVLRRSGAGRVEIVCLARAVR
jgi:predicted amidophosphoribosyltransferase